jgi:hypothetical protein
VLKLKGEEHGTPTCQLQLFSLLILPHTRLESVTNCQLSVTFAMDGVCFAPALKRCSTVGHHAKKDPWHSERGCKQAGTLNVDDPILDYRKHAPIATTKNSAASRHRVPRLLNEPGRREH